MVRPISSKRKLFNSNKYQFKENEPSQIKTGESNSVSSYPYSSSTQFPRAKPINYAKRSLSDSTDCDKKQECTTKSTVDGLKKCNSENAVDALAPSRIVMPMSERQQIALVMQLSSPSPTGKSEDLSCNTPSTPTTPLLGRGLAKRNERGETLLHVAAIKGDCEKVAQLISQGANVNAADYAGWTALHEACNRGFITIASLLIKGGADVNAKGFDNDTPLHDACVNNHYQIVRLLLTSGAKPDFVNSRGKSPFDICRSPKVLILLEEAKLGKLEPTEISTSISSKVSVQEIEQTLCELGFVSLNNNWPSIEASETVPSMSRKTPPNNKPEEKLSPQVSVASPTTGASSSAPASVSGSAASSAGNSRPVSPRIPMRLQHGTRTPDKVSNLGGKNSSESDDVYEFRCSKDDSKEGETTEKTAEPTSTKSPDPTLTTPDTKSEKRLRDSEQAEEEDESKKKRKKEDNKEGVKGNARGAGSSSRPSTADKFSKVNQRPSSNNGKNQSPNLHSTTTTSSAITTSSTASSNSSSTCSTTLSASMDQKKSPSNSASNSPKPPCSMPTTKTDKSDSDNEELKHDSNPWAPKVPPLKIVLAPCSLSEQETNSQSGKNTNGRQLPYVVNSSSGSAEEKEKEGSSADSSSKESTVLKDEASTKDSTKGYSPLPVVTSSSSPTPTTTASAAAASQAVPTSSENSPGSVANSPSSSSCSNNNSGNNGTSTTSAVTSDKGSATRITRSQRGGGNSGSSSNSDDGQVPSVKIEPKTEDPPSTTPEVIHPRKRKIKMKESEPEPCPPPIATPEQPQQHISNGYEMFLKIRKQIERRRKLLFPVQPKPPQGFKDYLMNRCSYVLANNANSHLAVPIISPPSTLPQPLKDLFSEQEQERYKLRLQQLIEKEKLVLSVEQEILRVHGRAARALANQVLPFSVCTILKDEEVYNVISPEQEDKERNARSRYNGRLFLSWLQDVDDKWEKIKEAMVLRHHNEAESLHAVQKMDWEWKLKELGMVEANMRTSVDDLHVPMVQVADFDLLPA